MVFPTPQAARIGLREWSEVPRQKRASPADLGETYVLPLLEWNELGLGLPLEFPSTAGNKCTGVLKRH